MDGIYSRLLLLKKKKYAGMKIDGLADGNMKDHQEVKGLDLVRRDWALIAKESGFKVLGMILNAKMGIDEVIENIHEYLKQLANDVREGKISVAKFFIQKVFNHFAGIFLVGNFLNFSFKNIQLRMSQEFFWSKKPKISQIRAFLILIGVGEAQKYPS